MKKPVSPAALPAPAELTALCREWQRRLRLQDWRVRIRYAEKYEIDGSQARTRICSRLKQALVLINPHASNEDFGVDPVEVNLLHELVHIHIDVLMPKDIAGVQEILYEQAVDLLAWALYRAKHGAGAEDEFVDAQ